MRASIFGFTALLILIAGCGPDVPPEIAEAGADLPERIDFNLHIKPILSDRCFACHGPDNNARKADLRLDRPEGAYAALTEGDGFPIVPGNLRKSQVYHRLVSSDPEHKMPPPESNLTISSKEIAYILKWIEQGAEYKEHWSLIPPEKPERPEVESSDWPINGIDWFVLDRLEREGLAPSPEASKETLIRRVSMDLTGLPPTLEEIDAFLADESSDAYEKVVDRLLASDHYGERMAVDWLDLARYADSHGYQDDGLRNMWPWRDWVIRAFNDNLPYDAFVTWQLAGDLLPDPTREQILATGFNRNHLQSQEGGIVPEEYRVEYVADRVQTVGKAFLGITVECGRCHDHKYDDFSQEDYYKLFAFFNNNNEFGNIPYAGEASPALILTDEEADARLEVLRAQIRDYEQQTDIRNEIYDEGFEQWIASGQTTPDLTGRRLLGHYPMDRIQDRELTNLADRTQPATLSGDPDKIPITIPGKFGTAQKLVGDSFFDFGDTIGQFERNEPFTISLWFNIADEDVMGPLFARSGGYFDGNRGYLGWINEDRTLSASLNHVFPDNSIEIQTLDPLPAGSWQHLVMTYDGSSRAEGLRLYMNGEPAETKVNVDHLRQSTLYTVDPRTHERTNWTGNGRLRIGMIDANMTRLDSVAVDEMRVFADRLTALEVSTLFGEEDPLGAVPATMDDRRASALRDYYVTKHDPLYKEAFRKLTELRAEENEIMTAQPSVMVMRERKEPRPTFVLARGAYDAPTDQQVSPGMPSSIQEYSEELPENRLGLAKWLMDPENPLTARVTVNRYWQRYFGQGIVTTPDDFGNQGALPSHPLLLDWLATTFVESGWDVKAMQKAIVMSATYRQSSMAGPELLERDPDNKLLARGPSYRWPAEVIRDHALAVSGLLVREIGGPSVKPYQPEGLWEELATRNATVYVQDHGDKLYRRSLYTIWKRTTPPPSMISFDASERNFCQVKRHTTSTPLQALILLNDPQYLEAARILAERMIKEGGSTDNDRITFAFRLLTSRRPLSSELKKLVELYRAELEEFQKDRPAAKSFLSVGEYPVDPTLDPTEVAAYALVVSTIMNFDEAVIKR